MKNKKRNNKRSLLKKLAIKYKWIHYSKKTRMQWRWANIGIYFIIFIFFIGAAISWTIGGLKFDTNIVEQYIWPTNKTLFILGLVLFIVGTILLVLFGFYLAAIFNKSRLIYFKTNEYAKNKLKYMEKNLTKYSIKEIKWLYRLCYIDKAKRDATLTKIKS